MGRSPGVRSYTVQLLSLLLSAIRVGELRQVLSPAGAGTWRQRLRDVAECLEETIQAQDALAQQMATALCEEDNWVFVGSGPSYATALFSAAKLVESCGASAWAQDVEEWAHIQYFNSQERTPTCLLMPSGASAERSLELLPYVKGVGRHTSVVARDTQPISLTQVDTLFPVPQAVPEIFSPLVYCVAGEFLAYYLSEAKNTTFFQATGDGVPDPGQRLRGSQVLRHLPTVHASHEDSDA
jgi:glucosamine--fructose-6-phosphate aminotransferase (isomerizing)